MPNAKLPNGYFDTIERLHVFIAKNPSGGEGIMAFNNGMETMMPMAFCNADLLERMKQVADEISKVSGVPYEIRIFERVKDERK